MRNRWPHENAIGQSRLHGIAGFNFTSYIYDKHVFRSGSSITEQQSKSAVEPFGMAGVQLQYNPWKEIVLKATVDYCMLAEEKKQYSFMSYALGAGWGF